MYFKEKGLFLTQSFITEASIIVAVICFVTITILFIIMFKDKIKEFDETKDEQNFIIKPRRGAIGSAIAGALTITVFILGFLQAMRDSEYGFPIIGIWYLSIVPLGMGTLVVIVVLHFCRWKVIVKGEDLIHTAIIGKKTSFKFQDISRFEIREKIFGRFQDLLFIYTYLFDKNNKRLCKISSSHKNADCLIPLLLKREIPFQKIGKYTQIWPPPYDFEY